jgi:hypothetical protein
VKETRGRKKRIEKLVYFLSNAMRYYDHNRWDDDYDRVLLLIMVMLVRDDYNVKLLLLLLLLMLIVHQLEIIY